MWNNEDACIKCSICISACPVYAQDINFAGPKALGPDWFRSFEQDNSIDPISYVDDCTFCQLCERSCPVGVPIAHLIALHKTKQKKPLRIRLRDSILARPHWIAPFPWLANVPTTMAKALNFGTKSRWPHANKLGNFKITSQNVSLGTTKPTIGIFIDCYSRGFDQEVIFCTQQLLSLWGFETRLLPSYSHCCGAAAYAAGKYEQGQKIASSTYKALSKDLKGLGGILTLNATCDSTLTQEWPNYWNLDLKIPIVSFVQFALDNAPESFWKSISTPVDDSDIFWIHTTCRSRVSKGDGNLSTLVQKAGLGSVRLLDLDCCGAAGSYAFKQEHEDVAHELGERVLEQISQPLGNLVLDSGTCGLHLSQITGLEAKHPAYWIYQRYNNLIEKG